MGFVKLASDIAACERCPRLRAHCLAVAAEKRRAYRDQPYWGRPVPGFGDPEARIWILGLAPGAHGANRTGRVFTGDRSGEWLYGALHRHGLSTTPHSANAHFARPEDPAWRDLRCNGAYISCVARCAPPDNKPSRNEISACRGYLDTEWRLLAPRLRVILALGKMAWDVAITLPPFANQKPPRFSHAARMSAPPSTVAPHAITLLASFHPSQQNTFTGKLTPEMWEQTFVEIAKLASSGSPSPDQ